MSGFSVWMSSAHFNSNSDSLSTDSITAPLTGSHDPSTKQWFKYGSVSPYFINVEPIKVTLSPSNSGKIEVIASSMNFSFWSLVYCVLNRTSVIVALSEIRAGLL